MMHRSMSTVHAANICMWLKRNMNYDPVKEEFIDDAEANRFLLACPARAVGGVRRRTSDTYREPIEGHPFPYPATVGIAAGRATHRTSRKENSPCFNRA